jgi:hypothetical protein
MVERALRPAGDSEASGHEIVFTPSQLIERESVAAPPQGSPPAPARARAKAVRSRR